MTRFASVAVALTLWLLPTAAHARPVSHSFAEVAEHLVAGDTLFVINRAGHELSGTLLRVSPTSLVMLIGGEQKEIHSGEIGRIEKSGDSVWDGVWKGYLYSTPHWTLVTAATCDRTHGIGCPIGRAVLAGAPWGAIGAYTDWRHKGRATIYMAQGASASNSPVSVDELWMKISSGARVSVTDVSGEKTRGTFLEVSGSSVALVVDGQRREIPGIQVRQVARRGGDSVWNGALIGAAFGATAVAFDRSREDRVPFALIGAYMYGAIGAGIDALIPRDTAVYRAQGSRTVRVTPVIGRTRAGFMVSAEF